MKRVLAVLTTSLLLLLGGACGGDDAPSAEDIRAEAGEQAEKAGDRTREVADKAADKAQETAKDVADGTDKPSLKIDSPVDNATVTGGAAELRVLVSGVTIVKADGDTSGKTGHFHVFVDREPMKVGEVIPQETGIVHSATNPIAVPGLSPGRHTLVVVLGDGTHKRIHGDAEARVTVNVTA